ncbi:MAG: hypothetical protein M1838_002443 [Thelocarpon superellum]|nr:MAG: hypothetical protein M1838_002443 [Thelocarpon superellum]
MGDRCAFFYGTLMAKAVLHRVCYGPKTPEAWQAQSLTITPAILHAHSRHKVRGCDYPAIVPTPGTSVRGTFVTGLTEGDLLRLDVFEGDEYERRKVRVKLLTPDEQEGCDHVEGEGEAEEAETYVWVSGRYRLEEGEWDFALFVREKMQRWIGEDEGFAGG